MNEKSWAFWSPCAIRLARNRLTTLDVITQGDYRRASRVVAGFESPGAV